jgi:hypothetical protein
MDMRATCREEDSVSGEAEEGIDGSASSYDRKTGDGNWLKASLKMLQQAIKRTEADSTPEPHKTMR